MASSGMLRAGIICMPFQLPLSMQRNQFGSWTVSSIFAKHLTVSFFVLNKLIGWLSPELYLRRPPAQNEGYRLDRMLQAAAQRGVSVRIMVYKEVAQVLTRKIHRTW